MFLLLLGIEALFFILLGMLLYSFTTLLYSSLGSMDSFLMTQPWATEDPTAENLGTLNIPGTDLSKIQQKQAAIAGAARSLALWGTLLFIVSRAFSYTLSLSIMRKRGPKELIVQFWKSAFVGSILAGMMLFLGWRIILEIALYLSAIQPVSLAFLTIGALGLLVLLYIFPLALSLAQLIPLKRVAPEALRHGFFSFFKIVSGYALIILLMAIPVLLLFFFFEYNVVITFFLMLGFLSALVYGRTAVIFLVSGIAQQQENTHFSESGESMVRTRKSSEHQRKKQRFNRGKGNADKRNSGKGIKRSN